MINLLKLIKYKLIIKTDKGDRFLSDFKSNTNKGIPDAR